MTCRFDTYVMSDRVQNPRGPAAKADRIKLFCPSRRVRAFGGTSEVVPVSGEAGGDRSTCRVRAGAARQMEMEGPIGTARTPAAVNLPTLTQRRQVAGAEL